MPAPLANPWISKKATNGVFDVAALVLLILLEVSLYFVFFGKQFVQ